MALEAPPPPRTACIVANPVAGRGKGETRAAALAAALERRGVAVELLRTGARGEVERLLARARPAALVIAVGGDGTLSELLQALPDARTPVGLLPCGTANVLAHALRLCADPERAADSFLRGRIQELDVARVGPRLSHLVVGVGFDARIVHEVEARRRGPITKAAYLSAALRTLRRYRPVPLRVTLDGRELSEPAGMVLVANTPKYADLLRFARDTRLDDGRWEVVLFPSARVPELLSALAHGLVPGLPGSPVRIHRARAVQVSAAEPVPYQVDGDRGGETPVEVELLPVRFRILVP